MNLTRGVLSTAPRIEQLNYLRLCLHGFSSIDEYITVCSANRNQSFPCPFLITDSVRSLPMELGAMTHGKLHFRELIWCAVKWKCSQYRNAFALSNLLAGQKDHEEIRGEAVRL